MSSIALLLVDLQRDFFDESRNGVGHLEKAICLPAVKRILSHARRQGWRVVHAITVHDGPDTLPVPLRRNKVEPYCLRGTPGASIVDGLRVTEDVIVEKQNFSAFSGTHLGEILDGYDHLVTAGIAVDCCVLATAFEACGVLQKAVYVPYQAVAATHERNYLAALEMIAKSAGAVIDAGILLEGGDPSWDRGLKEPAIKEKAGQWVKSGLEVVRKVREGATKADRSVLADLRALECSLGEF